MLISFALSSVEVILPALANECPPPEGTNACGWGSMPEGVVDVDGDGYPNVELRPTEAIVDCDDADPTIHVSIQRKLNEDRQGLRIRWGGDWGSTGTSELVIGAMHQMGDVGAAFVPRSAGLHYMCVTPSQLPTCSN